MKKRKIAVIASSRATYGYKRRLINLMHKSPCIELQLIVTGMHLIKQYGYSILDIKQDKYPIAAKVDIELKKDLPFAWAKSIGTEIKKLPAVFHRLKPDMVLVTGDRAEMFAAAVASVYMNIPVAHIQAGDVSGHIDGSIRHAITKLSHLHFASCNDSAKRVAALGEEKWRIFNVGAPQLDEIIHAQIMPREDIENNLKLDLNKKTILVIQHPVLIQNHQAYLQMKETMEAIKKLKLQTIVIYPNIDAGGKQIIKAINEYSQLPFIKKFANLSRPLFINLLRYISVIIGNSSCGILEAPSFKLPAVNIGDRQRGRMQAINVINAGHKTKDITEAVEKVLFDEDFRAALKQCVNPYGDGNSSERILRILSDIKINNKLLDKKITY